MTSTSTSLRFAVLITATSGFLDTYTLLVRGGVFANAQTGNTILMALSLARGDWNQAMAHVWPMVAFAAGIITATHIQRGRIDHVLAHPIRWTVALQILVLTVVGFVPATVPASLVTVPITYVAAIQMGLFRSVSGLAYMSIAVTGNLMRLVESGYDHTTAGTDQTRKAVRTYTAVVAALAGGALLGGGATHLLGVHASWIAAALLGSTLALFVLDEGDRSPAVAVRA